MIDDVQLGLAETEIMWSPTNARLSGTSIPLALRVPLR
jgi:hypothetical protein